MIYECNNLTSLDTTKFDTSEATNFYSIFDGCSSLKSFVITQMNTEEVTTMNSKFRNFKSLEFGFK